METRPRYTLFPTAKPPSPPHSRGAPAPSDPGTLRLEPRILPLQTEPLSNSENSYSTEEAMHIPRPSDSSDSSNLSFHKTTDLSCAPPATPIPLNRPRTVYIHNGIGGRGNYHKMIKEKDNAPNQTLQPAPSRRQNNTRFLSSLFGSKKRQRQQQYDGGASVPREQGRTVEVGAAEIMRRKILGERAEGKRSLSSNRS